MIRSGRMRNELRTKIADRVSTRPFHVGRFAFEADNVFLMEPQFRRVLDRHDPFAVRDENC